MIYRCNWQDASSLRIEDIKPPCLFKATIKNSSRITVYRILKSVSSVNSDNYSFAIYDTYKLPSGKCCSQASISKFTTLSEIVDQIHNEMDKIYVMFNDNKSIQFKDEQTEIINSLQEFTTLQILNSVYSFNTYVVKFDNTKVTNKWYLSDVNLESGRALYGAPTLDALKQLLINRCFENRIVFVYASNNTNHNKLQCTNRLDYFIAPNDEKVYFPMPADNFITELYSINPDDIFDITYKKSNVSDEPVTYRLKVTLNALNHWELRHTKDNTLFTHFVGCKFEFTSVFFGAYKIGNILAIKKLTVRNSDYDIMKLSKYDINILKNRLKQCEPQVTWVDNITCCSRNETSEEKHNTLKALEKAFHEEVYMPYNPPIKIFNNSNISDLPEFKIRDIMKGPFFKRNDKSEYAPGTFVHHIEYGIGNVIGYDINDYPIVRFEMDKDIRRRKEKHCNPDNIRPLMITLESIADKRLDVMIAFKTAKEWELLKNTFIDNTTGFKLEKVFNIAIIKDGRITTVIMPKRYTDTWAGLKVYALGPSLSNTHILADIIEEYFKEEPKLKIETVIGKRYVSHGKHKGEEINTITTKVSVGCVYGQATCDESEYNERDGILNALANAVCGGNFDRLYDRWTKETKAVELAKDKKDRTCSYCGKLLDSTTEREEHEKWHVECRKAKHERYLIRKEAKKRLAEEQSEIDNAKREKEIEKVMKELKKEQKK